MTGSHRQKRVKSGLWFLLLIAMVAVCDTAVSLASNVQLPSRASVEQRANRVVLAVSKGAQAILSCNREALVELLAHEDRIVRFCVWYMAPKSDQIVGPLTWFVGFDSADVGIVETAGFMGEREAPSLRSELERYYDSSGRPWVSPVPRGELADKGRLLDRLIGQLRWCNNEYHFALFGKPEEQAETSLLMLALAEHARGTQYYESAAAEAICIFAGKRYDQLRRQRYEELRAQSTNISQEPDERDVDKQIDWHWELLKYCYFHPLSRHFYLDGSALHAGVPSAQYRRNLPWGEDEGPNGLPETPLNPAAQMRHKARLKAAEEARLSGSEAGIKTEPAEKMPFLDEAPEGGGKWCDARLLIIVGAAALVVTAIAVAIAMWKRKRS